jgi:hypothetical protein
MVQFECVSNTVRVSRILLLASVLGLVFAGCCLGDQLQWNPLAICRDAAAAIAAQPLLVSFCSQADEDHVELWLVRDLHVTLTSAPRLYELVATMVRLYTSDRAFSSEELPVPDEEWAFHEAEDPRCLVAGLDLAYVYVYAGSGSFLCLGEMLGLPCTVGVHAIRLPDLVVEAVEARWQPKQHPVPWSTVKPLKACHRSGL